MFITKTGYGLMHLSLVYPLFVTIGIPTKIKRAIAGDTVGLRAMAYFASVGFHVFLFAQKMNGFVVRHSHAYQFVMSQSIDVNSDTKNGCSAKVHDFSVPHSIGKS